MSLSLKRLFEFVAHCYLTPLWFEEKLYEFLGIRVFKKYLPTSGDLMMRYVRKKKMLMDSKTDTLTAYAHFTITLEGLHVMMFGFFLFVLLIPFERLWIYVVVMNVFGNVYPIMLQRYNRARIYRLLKKREQHGKEITSTSTALQLRRFS